MSVLPDSKQHEAQRLFKIAQYMLKSNHSQQPTLLDEDLQMLVKSNTIKSTIWIFLYAAYTCVILMCSEQGLSWSQTVKKFRITTTQKRLLIAQCLMELQQYQKAKEMLEMVIQDAPYNFAAQLQLVVVLEHCNQTEQMVEILQKISKIWPDNALVWRFLAYYHRYYGDNKKAKRYCRKACKLAPTDAEALNLLGVIIHKDSKKSAQMKKALNCFQKSIILNPCCSSTYINLAAAQYKVGHYERALNSFKKAISFPSFQNENLYILSLILGKLQQVDLIVKVCEQQTVRVSQIFQRQLNTTDQICNSLGINQLVSQNWYGNQHQLYKISSKDSTTIQNLVSTQFSQHNPKKAVETLQKKLKMLKGNSTIYYRLGSAYQYLSQFRLASQCLQKAYEKRPHQHNLLIVIARLAISSNQINNAIAWLQIRIELQKNVQQTHFSKHFQDNVSKFKQILHQYRTLRKLGVYQQLGYSIIQSLAFHLYKTYQFEQAPLYLKEIALIPKPSQLKVRHIQRIAMSSLLTYLDGCCFYQPGLGLRASSPQKIKMFFKTFFEYLRIDQVPLEIIVILRQLFVDQINHQAFQKEYFQLFFKRLPIELPIQQYLHFFNISVFFNNKNNPNSYAAYAERFLKKCIDIMLEKQSEDPYNQSLIDQIIQHCKFAFISLKNQSGLDSINLQLKIPESFFLFKIQILQKSQKKQKLWHESIFNDFSKEKVKFNYGNQARKRRKPIKRSKEKPTKKKYSQQTQNLRQNEPEFQRVMMLNQNVAELNQIYTKYQKSRAQLNQQRQQVEYYAHLGRQMKKKVKSQKRKIIAFKQLRQHFFIQKLRNSRQLLCNAMVEISMKNIEQIQTLQFFVDKCNKNNLQQWAQSDIFLNEKQQLKYLSKVQAQVSKDICPSSKILHNKSEHDSMYFLRDFMETPLDNLSNAENKDKTLKQFQLQNNGSIFSYDDSSFCDSQSRDVQPVQSYDVNSSTLHETSLKRQKNMINPQTEGQQIVSQIIVPDRLRIVVEEQTKKSKSSGSNSSTFKFCSHVSSQQQVDNSSSFQKSVGFYKKNLTLSQTQQIIQILSKFSQQFQQLSFNNHVLAIKYFTSQRNNLQYIARHHFEKAQFCNQNYKSFRMKIQKGNDDFIDEKHQQLLDTLKKQGPKEAICWLVCIIRGILQLQERGIFHPDIALRNTIQVKNLQEKGKSIFKNIYKIIDFNYVFKFAVHKTDKNNKFINNTKKMISFWLQKTDKDPKFIDYFFPSDLLEDHTWFQHLYPIINNPNRKLEQKIDSILQKLKQYSLKYHHAQFLSILQSFLTQKPHLFSSDQINKEIRDLASNINIKQTDANHEGYQKLCRYLQELAIIQTQSP